MKKIKDYLLSVSTLDRSILYITLLIAIGIVGIVSYKNIYIRQSSIGLDSLLAEPVPGSPEYNYKYGYPSQDGIENLPETPPDYISKEEIENIKISVKMDGKRFKQSLDGYPAVFTSSVPFALLREFAPQGFHVLLASKACAESRCYLEGMVDANTEQLLSRWPDYAVDVYGDFPVQPDGKIKIPHPVLRIALPEGEYVFIISLSLTGNRGYEGLLTDTVVKEIITEPFFLERPIKKIDWIESGGEIDEALIDVSIGEKLGAFTVSGFNYKEDLLLTGIAQLTGTFSYAYGSTLLCFGIDPSDLDAPNLKEHSIGRRVCFKDSEKQKIESLIQPIRLGKSYTLEVRNYTYVPFEAMWDTTEFLRVVP